MANMLIEFILDRSGSMMLQVPDVIEHFNKYIEEVASLKETIDLEVVQFDDQYEILRGLDNIKYAKPLTIDEYYSRGSTALNDAIGRTINRVAARRFIPPKVVFVINTDGYENASREFNKPQIKALIERYKEERNWQFVFVGAGIDAFSEGSSYGVGRGQTVNSTNTSYGTRYRYATLTQSTSDFADVPLASAATAKLQISDVTEEEWQKKDKKKKEKSPS